MSKPKSGLITVGVLVGIGALLHWHFTKPDVPPAPVPVVIVPSEPEPAPAPAPEPKPKPEPKPITRDFSKTDYRVLLKRFNAWQCEANRSPITPDDEIYYVFQELLRRPEVRWDQKSTSMQEYQEPQYGGRRRGRR